jgi:hypothetical protein
VISILSSFAIKEVSQLARNGKYIECMRLIRAWNRYLFGSKNAVCGMNEETEKYIKG